MRIAIIGAGLGGLACALECERLGVIPDIFERDESVGWAWPCTMNWLNVLERQMGDVREHLREVYNLDIKPLNKLTSMVLKSPNKEAKIQGTLGYILARGKHKDSIENQLHAALKRTPVHFNRFADYKELSKKYDYVVVATGKDTAAKELGVWEDFGLVHLRGGLAFGTFEPTSCTVYFNTEYAGRGYARLAPLSSTQAVVGLCGIGCEEYEVDKLYADFIERENLAHLEFYYKFSLPIFSTGRASKFVIDNVLLVGRSAGLTERFLGTGAVGALVSGILAARAMIQDLDYEFLVRPLWKHVENISALRKPYEQLDNTGLDRLVSIIDTPGVKQSIYNTGINFVDMAGGLLRQLTRP
ncbi:MAG TPA: FAD-dependent oxidoreductase [Spirochaetia bacterium]|nr:FAD-dependent oxidoreductase [Spirochaetia bacterium]